LNLLGRTAKAFPGALIVRARRTALFEIWMNTEIASRGRTI